MDFYDGTDEKSQIQLPEFTPFSEFNPFYDENETTFDSFMRYFDPDDFKFEDEDEPTAEPEPEDNSQAKNDTIEANEQENEPTAVESKSKETLNSVTF